MSKKKTLPKNVRERDGKYYYRYSVKDGATGKRKQKETPGFATARAAEREGIRIQSELLQGTHVEKSKITFTTWATDWMKWYATTGVKERTINQRQSLIDMLNRHIGGLHLSEISEDVYQEVLFSLSASNTPQNTITSIHGCARMIFERALQKGKINKDPTEGAFIPKKKETLAQREESKKLPRFLEKDELNRFLSVFEDGQYRRLFGLLAYTGMRIGELFALFPTDFTTDLKKEEGYLVISKTLYIPEGVNTHRLTTPKNESSDRTIFLSKKAISIIDEQLAWRREFAFSKGDRFYKEQQFMFVSQKSKAGFPLYQNTVGKAMRAALKKAKLPTNLTPHSLRHTYTSLMAEAGADLDTIQAQLGHKKGSDVTRGIYLHVTKAREKRDVQRLDDLLNAVE